MLDVEGRKKQKQVSLLCRSCGEQSKLDPVKKIIEFVMGHLLSEAELAEFATKGTAAALQGQGHSQGQGQGSGQCQGRRHCNMLTD